MTAKEDESEASSFVAAAAKAAKEEGQHANVRRGAGGALEMDLNLGGVQTTVVGTMDASPEGAEEAEKVEGINLPFAVVPPPMPPSSGSSDGSGTVVQGVQDEVKTGPGISAPLQLLSFNLHALKFFTPRCSLLCFTGVSAETADECLEFIGTFFFFLILSLGSFQSDLVGRHKLIVIAGEHTQFLVVKVGNVSTERVEEVTVM